MGRCKVCKAQSAVISGALGICAACIRRNREQALRTSNQIHIKTRRHFGLPPAPPQAFGGLYCGQCANQCRIPEGEAGFCGIVENLNRKLIRHGGTPQKGVLRWYYDALPTNCVSWWFCPGCTGTGYPRFAYQPTAETNHVNLAVFYGSCSSDCLFCQNWSYRYLARTHKGMLSAQQLASKADEKTSCICFFGGDPSTQMPHALKTSQIALKKARKDKRILRICWETNGLMLSTYVRQAARLSLKSGGNMKFDLKAWNESLNKALCGSSNRTTLKNFAEVGRSIYNERPELPVLAASTLLVPGYIDSQEVEHIARFIAQTNPEIPYTLLAFYPAYRLDDLPNTSRKQARECYTAAKKHLENVRIGNMHLLR